VGRTRRHEDLVAGGADDRVRNGDVDDLARGDSDTGRRRADLGDAELARLGDHLDVDVGREAGQRRLTGRRGPGRTRRGAGRGGENTRVATEGAAAVEQDTLLDHHRRVEGGLPGQFTGVLEADRREVGEPRLLVGQAELDVRQVDVVTRVGDLPGAVRPLRVRRTRVREVDLRRVGEPGVDDTHSTC